MPFNDTWGDISPEELAKMRANAEPCVTCGMLATVNPVLHENRYGHAPAIARDGRRLQWHAGGPRGPGWAEVDTASSASRQHYTKTGRYLLRLTWEARTRTRARATRTRNGTGGRLRQIGRRRGRKPVGRNPGGAERLAGRDRLHHLVRA